NVKDDLESVNEPDVLHDEGKNTLTEPSLSEGRLLESLGPNPSYTATKSIQLIPDDDRSPGDSSPHATEDQLLLEDSTMDASTISFRFPPTLLMGIYAAPSSNGKRKGGHNDRCQEMDLALS
ncbi:hypothetical protein BT69DRAFT_1288548, partial [Atractiella rhizophila]